MPQPHAAVGVLVAHERRLSRPVTPLRPGAVFQAARDAMAVLDDDRRLIDANPAACRLLGLKSAQLVGRQLDEFIATDARGVFSEQWPALLRNGGDHAGYELERKDGSRAAIEFTATDQLAPGRYLWIIRDIEKQGGLSEPGRSNRRPMLDAQSVGGFGHWEWGLASGRMDQPPIRRIAARVAEVPGYGWAPFEPVALAHRRALLGSNTRAHPSR